MIESVTNNNIPGAIQHNPSRILHVAEMGSPGPEPGYKPSLSIKYLDTMTAPVTNDHVPLPVPSQTRRITERYVILRVSDLPHKLPLFGKELDVIILEISYCDHLIGHVETPWA